MSKVKMVASENLLQSVIISQNADMMNGIRELIQNGIDAYHLTTTKPVIEILIPDAKTLIYRDWGKSLGNSKEEVISNFFVFGNSGKSAEQLGKFGIGRGQIMAMIYDPDTKKLNGTHTISSGNFTIQDIDILNLEAQIFESSYVQGMEWEIKSNDAIFEVEKIREYLSSKILTAIDIRLNGELVSKPIEGCIKYSTPNFDLFIDEKNQVNNYISVYERGIFAANKVFCYGFSGSLITKVPLCLNFARNEIVDNKIWKQIVKEVEECIYKFAQRDKTKFERTRRSGLTRMLANRPNDFPYLENLPIVELANGTVTKFTEIAKAKKLYRGVKDSRLADIAITVGHFVVDDDSVFYWGGATILEKYGIKITELENSEHGLQFKSSSFTEIEISQLTPFEIRMIDVMMNLTPDSKDGRNTRRAIRIGAATYVHECWTDGRTIWINRTEMEKLETLNNESTAMCALIPMLAHEYAHYSDDRVNDTHDYSFNERLVTCQSYLVDSYLTSLRSR